MTLETLIINCGFNDFEVVDGQVGQFPDLSKSPIILRRATPNAMRCSHRTPVVDW